MNTKYWRSIIIVGCATVILGAMLVPPVIGAANISPTSRPITTAVNAPTNIGTSVSIAALQNGPNLTFVSTLDTPTIALPDALALIDTKGIPFALGGQYAGKTVAINATHGRATFGFAADTSKVKAPRGGQFTGGCAGWLGTCNIPVQQCVKGQGCTLTGQVIPRLENRPMWIIDYGNIVFPTSGRPANHAVYAIDDQTRSVILIWGYNGP